MESVLMKHCDIPAYLHYITLTKTLSWWQVGATGVLKTQNTVATTSSKNKKLKNVMFYIYIEIDPYTTFTQIKFSTALLYCICHYYTTHYYIKLVLPNKRGFFIFVSRSPWVISHLLELYIMSWVSSPLPPPPPQGVRSCFPSITCQYPL